MSDGYVVEPTDPTKSEPARRRADRGPGLAAEVRRGRAAAARHVHAVGGAGRQLPARRTTSRVRSSPPWRPARSTVTGTRLGTSSPAGSPTAAPGIRAVTRAAALRGRPPDRVPGQPAGARVVLHDRPVPAVTGDGLGERPADPPPGRRHPAGRSCTTTPTTSALQFRQRLIADATVRSLEGRDRRHHGGGAPVHLEPRSRAGLPGPGAGVRAAGRRTPRRPSARSTDPATPYHGAVRPSPTAFRALSDAGRRQDPRPATERREPRGDPELAASPRTQFQRVFAMSGSAQWRVFPLIGIRLITARGRPTPRPRCPRSAITGPPFVAMSSNSGRFPLTVTNGLGRPITVTIAVTAGRPGAVGRADRRRSRWTPGQQRDVQVVTTAAGSGVTSVRARLATPSRRPASASPGGSTSDPPRSAW